MSLPERYTRTAIALHWLIAIAIVVNFALPYVWEALPRDQAGPIISLHKSLGITVIGLVLMRILWRLTHRPPAYPSRYAAWERGLSNLVHGALYLLMLAVPMAGYIIDSSGRRATVDNATIELFGIIPFPRLGAVVSLDPAAKADLHHLFEEVHELTAYALAALVLLHILGALKHQWIDREAELQRMLP